MRRLMEALPIGALAGIAACGSFTHIAHLAERSGQTGWMAYAIAVSVDLLAVVASLEIRRDKRLERSSTVPTLMLAGAIVLTLGANLAEAQRTPWGFIVAGVPAAAFLLAVALIERRGGASSQQGEPVEEPAQEEVQEEAVPEPVVEPEPAPEPKPRRKLATPRQRKPISVDELIARAREADATHREKHGKPISRDKLRTVLGVSTGTASDVLRELRAA